VIPPEEVGAIEDYDAVVLGSAVYMGSVRVSAMLLRVGTRWSQRPRQTSAPATR